MKRNLILVTILAGLVVATVGWFGLAGDEPTRTEEPVRYNKIEFVGTVTADESFQIEGILSLSAWQENHSRFDNASLRLYDRDETLMASHCFGRLTKSGEYNVSFTHPNPPAYVIFTSPDFWDADRVGDSSTDYYYREGGDYRPRVAVVESELPVDVTRHSPCA